MVILVLVVSRAALRQTHAFEKLLVVFAAMTLASTMLRTPYRQAIAHGDSLP